MLRQGICCAVGPDSVKWGMEPDPLYPRLVLALETSCDETAGAVLEGGARLLSNVVASQIAVHREYGGIVPELASRHHIEAIAGVVDAALTEAGLCLDDIDGVAVTQGPGLVGSLVVGLSFAKAIAVSRGLPLAGVDHVQAHLTSVFLEQEVPGFPYVGMVVSGGHTSLHLVRDHLTQEFLGGTRDDAAGEAFDKVAKILGLDYPGGPEIGRRAPAGRAGAFAYPRARLPETPFDFSFSGVKTAVLTCVRDLPTEMEIPVADICASFQEAVVEVLVEKAVLAARRHGILDVVVCGGVAANRRLRTRMYERCRGSGLNVFFPAPALCTDNAAMVALAGYHRIRAGLLLPMDADVYSRTPSAAG